MVCTHLITEKSTCFETKKYEQRNAYFGNLAHFEVKGNFLLIKVISVESVKLSLSHGDRQTLDISILRGTVFEGMNALKC